MVPTLQRYAVRPRVGNARNHPRHRGVGDPMSKLAIDLVGDLVCPWCYLGMHRLERVVAALGAEDRVEITLRPFLLRPATPPGGIDIHVELRKRFADLEPVFARLVGEAQRSELPLDPTRQRFVYSTIAAHALLRHAESRGTARALALALYRAHFDEARNISEPDVLAEIGARHGFSAEEVRTIVGDASELEITRHEASQASASGITGVPVFRISGNVLAGAQPEATLRAAIEAAL